MMNEQAIHIAYFISQAKRLGLKSIEVTEEAETRWVEFHEQSSGPIVKMWGECTPSFWNDEGKPSKKLVRNGQFGGGVFGLVDLLEQVRAEHRLDAFICRTDE
jgi:cyclohexanone monooxygenase